MVYADILKLFQPFDSIGSDDATKLSLLGDFLQQERLTAKFQTFLRETVDNLEDDLNPPDEFDDEDFEEDPQWEDDDTRLV